MPEPLTGGARGTALPTTSQAVTGIYVGIGEYLGMTVTATTGVTVTLYDNTTNSGTVLDSITIPSTGGSQSTFIPRPGKTVTKGIFAQITGGTPTGTVWT